MNLNKSAAGLTRREFCKRSAAAGAAIAIPWFVPARALGKDGAVAPSNRIALGAIGMGGRGSYVLDCLLSEPDVQFQAVADIRAQRREAIKGMVAAKYGVKECATYRDFRELLARPDIDAVLIATGDRWHALGSILAAKAGKHVYSEKPCALTMGLCAPLAETFHRYGRTFQAGTQRRSVPNFQAAVRLAQSGKLGKLHTLHASSYYPAARTDWLPAEPEPEREVVDWDLWLGPAPWRPYNKQYVSGGWRGFYDFDAGSSLLDWCAHTVDVCQWVIKADGSAPVEYEPAKDNITCRYANGVKLVIDFLRQPFGDRSPHYRTAAGTCPVRFEGDEGWVETGDSGAIYVSPKSLESELEVARRVAGTDPAGHGRNFLDCIKSGAPTNANVDVTRSSHVASHAASIACQLGRKLTFDPATESFVGDEEANRLRFRALRDPWRV